MEHIEGQMDIYECLEISSLDAMLERGWDVGDKYELQSRDGLVRDDDDEEPAE